MTVVLNDIDEMFIFQTMLSAVTPSFQSETSVNHLSTMNINNDFSTA